jgi:PHP family Zn ribbon phosphoesterase
MTNEEAKEHLKDILADVPNDKCIDWIEALNQAIKALEQESKTGHWEWVQYDCNPNIGNWHCSECRGICTKMHSIEDAYNYCPNCGAKMEVEE